MPARIALPLVLAVAFASSCGGCGQAPAAIAPKALLASPDAATLFVGQHLRLRLVAALTDNTTREVPAGEAEWVSSAPSLVSIEAGVAIARAPAKAVQLRATWNGLTALASVDVDDVRLVSLALEPPRLRLAKGESKAIRVTGTLSDERTVDLTLAEFGTTWSSSDEAIASVAGDGTITAREPGGPIAITATNGALSVSAELLVTAEPVTLARVEVRPARQTLALGTTGEVHAIAVFSDDTEADVTRDPLTTWSSSDDVAVTVDANGRLGARVAATGVAIVAGHEGRRGLAIVDVVDSRLVSLALAPRTLTLALGGTAALRLVGTYADGHAQDLTEDPATTFSADAPTLRIDGAIVTGASAGGPARVVARHGGLEAEALVTVLPAALGSIAIEPSEAEVRLRGTLQLKVTGTFEDGTTRDLTSASNGTTYASDSPGVVAIEPSGLARGEKLGAATIVARNGAFEARARLTVKAGADQILSLAIAPATARIDVGATTRLRVTATYGDGRTADVTPASAGTTWASADPALVEVDANGLVRGLSLGGPVTVSAGNQGVGASASVLVAPPPPPLVSLTATPPAIEGNVGSTHQLAITARFADGTARDLTAAAGGTTYAISGDPAVATVTANGLVTLRASGTAAVLVTNGAVNAVVAITVAPHDLVQLAVVPAQLDLPLGFSEQLKVTGLFSDGAFVDLTAASTGTIYSSARPELATVSADGLVTAHATGKLQLNVANGLLVRRVGARVREAEVASLRATANPASVPAGRTIPLACTATMTNGRLLDVTAAASGTTWLTGNASVARVSADGRVTGVSPGAVAMSCLNHGVVGAVTITVTAAVADEVVVTPAAALVPLGRLLPLAVSVLYSDGTRRDATAASSGTAWVSADPLVAPVSPDGVVTARAVGGPVAVTAVVSGKTRAAELTVAPAALEALSCSPAPLVVAAGASAPLAIEGRWSDGTVRPLGPAQGLTWRSSDEAIARVAADGTVSGVTPGATTVLAWAGGLAARCAVEVRAP